MKNKFIRNSIILSVLLIVFLGMDMLLKYLYFEYPGHNIVGPVKYEGTLIGIRSFAHDNSTLFSFLNINFARWVQIFIPVTLSVVIIFIIMFQTKKKFVIAFSVILVGMIGNTFDVISLGYVRDIMFTPWWDRGTFNLADVVIVSGVGLTLISMMTELFKRK